MKSCVYCGYPATSSTPATCGPHGDLPRLDPYYTPHYAPRMHAADEREAVSSLKERES